jgi:uncharacterized membrane protein YkvA (DUF1232 family)
MAEEDYARLIGTLESSDRKLPMDWRDRLEAANPAKRKSAAAHLDAATLKLADALFQASVSGFQNKAQLGSISRRTAAVALLYFLDETDLFPDAVSDAGLVDDRHALHWAGRRILGELQNKQEVEGSTFDPPAPEPRTLRKKPAVTAAKTARKPTTGARNDRPGRATGLSENDRARLIRNLKVRAAKLPLDWQSKIQLLYPEKRSELAARLDAETIALADRLARLIALDPISGHDENERRAAAALLYLLDHCDLIPDTSETGIGLLDDRFVICWTVREIWPPTDAERTVRTLE